MSKRPSLTAELLRLCGQMRDQTITPADAERLNTLLAENKAARQFYLRFMSLTAGLESQRADTVATPEDTASDNDVDLLLDLLRMEQEAHAELVHVAKPPRVKRLKKTSNDPSWSKLMDRSLLLYIAGQAARTKPAKWLAAAAVVALCVLIAIQFIGPATAPTTTPITDNTATESHMPAESAQPILRDQAVATLTAQHDAQWAPAGGASAPPANLSVGTLLHPNTHLTLTAGFAEITTAQGAVAILEAPATIEFTHNDNALHLHAGKLVGICETELSKGFVVKTDYADITDLGTEFGVNVADNQLTTTVFAGEVVLKTPGRATQPLVANQTATLIDDGDGLDLAIADQVAQGFTLRLPRTTTAEQVQSTATPIAAWDFFGQDTQAGVYSGDISTASGLQMTGFTGQWGTMPPFQGAIRQPDRSFITGETTGVSNGITLRWAVDGVGATSWAWVQPGNNHALFADYYFIQNPSRWGGAAIPWRIEGLNPGASYDIIFYGLDSHYHDGALIAIDGHDAGNGVGAAATLDDENDANFQSVVADADGFISGTFNVLEHGKDTAISGVQIGKLTVPGPSR